MKHDTLMLHPFLHKELSTNSGDVQCFIFTSTEHAIRDFVRQSGRLESNFNLESFALDLGLSIPSHRCKT